MLFAIPRMSGERIGSGVDDRVGPMFPMRAVGILAGKCVCGAVAYTLRMSFFTWPTAIAPTAGARQVRRSGASPVSNETGCSLHLHAGIGIS